jgi:hypothetical protein
MPTTHLFVQIAHVSAVLALGWLIWTAIRWVARRSTVIGAIFAAGVLTRIFFGVTLFYISYLQLPIGTSLQAGGGFWTLTADAQGYYELAADTIRTGVPIHDASVPSPFFIRTLALFMRIVGVSPLAGMFLNLCVYAGVVVAIVSSFRPINNWRRDLPCIAAIAAYSFSPVILIHATQPLKDELSSALVITACLGVLALRRLIYGNRLINVWTLAGLVAFFLATFGSAGIRWYFALLFWGLCAATLVLCGLWRRTTSFPTYALGVATALAVGWLGLWAGAGPYYPIMRAYVTLGPSHLSTVTQLSRRGFLMSGGGTNLVVPLRDDPAEGRAHEKDLVKRQWDAEKDLWRSAPPPPPRLGTAKGGVDAERARRVLEEQNEAARAIPVRLMEHLRVAATGLSFVFLPSSVAGSLLGTKIAGGRGLMPVADLDTVLQDITMILIAVLLWRRRQLIGDRIPLVVFGILVSAASAVLLAYVVTNFGTMWRLRSLAAIPFWMIGIALSPEPERSSGESPR